MKFEVDTQDAQKKLAGLSGLGKAYRWTLSRWSALAIRHVKEAIRGRLLNTRTAHLTRNVNFQVSGGDINPRAVLGTGVSPAKSVVYADIQERGGTIKPKNKQYLTVPLPGVKGTAANFPNAFIIKSKAGNLLIVERAGQGGIHPLFVLKKEVILPARGWFSIPIAEMTDLLNQMVSPPEILKVIGGMSTGGE